MSQRDVERTLGKLLTDEAFRDGFFADPAVACLHAGLELSREEAEAISGVPRPFLRILSACLDGRICRLPIRGGSEPEVRSG